MTKVPDPSTAQRWAHFRFAVVGSLLSSPPAHGELKQAIESLATKTWAHPVHGRQTRFSAATIERWYDSNLYLRRTRDRLALLTEHRAAPAAPPVQLELVSIDATMTHLEVVADGQQETPDDLESRVLALLADRQTRTRAKLRETLSVQNERLGRVLGSLEQTGRIHRTTGGWQTVN